MRDIGSKLKILRKSKKLTQQDVVERMERRGISLSRATLSNYEVGRRTPHLSLLRAFCDLYGVELAYFDVNEKDETFELISRARDVFSSDEISRFQKEEVYKQILRLYLEFDEKE